MVSRKTSTMPIIPCMAGWSVCADAWAMDAVPIPASLVKTPREQPVSIARKAEPSRPPVTALGETAPCTIRKNASGKQSLRTTRTPAQRRRYPKDAMGTTLSAAQPIRLAPPESRRPVSKASRIPIPRFRAAVSGTPKEASALLIPEITALTCVALPTPKEAITPNRQ